MRKFTFFIVLAIFVNGYNSIGQNVSSYTFTASSGTYSSLSSGATNTSLTATADDAISSAITLPFNFKFGYFSYNSIKVSSNGWMTFGTTTSNYNGNSSANASSAKPIIFPLWDDLQNRVIPRYRTDGTAPNRIFKLEWYTHEWNFSSNGDVISFQVWLYETSNVIEFIYQQGATAVNTGSSGASIGIYDANDTYLSLNGSGASPNASSSTFTVNIVDKPANGQIFRFTPSSTLDITQIGNGSSFDRNPFDAYYGYGRTVDLYKQSEIGTSGLITSLQWNCTDYENTEVPIKIYLKTTSSTTLSANTYDSYTTGATLVYDGTYNFFAGGWHSIQLSSPFYYNNSDNLLVICEANYGGTGASAYNGYNYSSATNCSQFWVQDNTPPTGNGTVESNRSDLRIVFRNPIVTSPPAVPTITLTAQNNSNNRVDISVTENQSNLVTYIPFEEGSGSTAYDWTANSNNGALSSGTYTTGKVGNGSALISNNSTTSTLITGTTNLPTNTFSYGGWFKTSAIHGIDAQSNTGTGGVNDQKYAVWPTQRGTSGGTGLSIGTNGISVYEHGNSYMPAVAVYNAGIGTDWNHIMVVYNSRTPSIYLNGVLVKTGVISGRATVYAPYEFAGGAYGAFNGQMDEIKVFNVALTQEQVLNEMYRGLNGRTYERSTASSGTYTPVKSGSYVSAETTSPSNISTSISGDYIFEFSVRQTTAPTEGWEVSDGLINVDRYSSSNNIRIHYGGAEKLNVYLPIVLNEFENIKIQRKGNIYRIFQNGVCVGEHNYGSAPAVSTISYTNAGSGTTTWKECKLSPMINSNSYSDTDAKDVDTPTVPTGLTVNVTALTTSLDLGWNAASDNGTTYYFSPVPYDAFANMSNLLTNGVVESGASSGNNAPNFDGSMKADGTKKIEGKISGYILKETTGEVTSQHNAVAIPDNTIQYRYGGWLYSNGPSVDYFFFSASSTSFYDGTYDAISSSATSKWELIQGTSTNVVGTDNYLTIRADNNGGSSGAGAVWFDRMFILPTKSVTVTSGMKDYYITGTGTGASTWITGTTKTITGLSANTEYCYTIKSRDNGDNESAQTESVCKYTRAADVTSFTNSIPSCGSIKLDWSGGSYTSIRVYCTTTSADIYSGTALTYTLNGLNPGSYTYRIYAKNGDGLENTTYVEQTVSVSVPVTTGMSAGDYAWYGGTSTEWTTASNWLVYNGASFDFAGAAPNSSSNVFLKNNGCTSNNATITSAVACNNLAIEYGTLVVSGSNVLTINGNYSNAGTFTKNTSKVIFAGGNANIITGGTGIDTKDFYDVEFNCTGTKTFVTNDMRVSNNLTLTSGTVNLDATRIINVYGSTITTNGASIICTNTSAHQFYLRGALDKTITGTGGIWNVRTRVENANLTIDAGCNITMNNTNNYFYWDGSSKQLQVNGSILGANSRFYINGNNNSLITSNVATCLRAVYFYRNVAGSTLNINSNFSISNSLTNSYNGTISFNDFDISIGSGLVNSQNGTFNLGNGTITVTGAVSNGTATYTSAIINAGSGTFSISGDYTNYGTFNHGNGTVILKGGSNRNINSGGIGVGKAFYNLTIDKSANTASAASNIEVDGNFTLTAGTWNLSASNYNMIVAGNWTHTGTSIFTSGSGTVTFDGVNSTITSSSSGTKSFNNLIVDDAVTLGSTLDVNGSLTINNAKSLSTSVSNFNITVGGSWTNSGTFTPGTATVTLDEAIAAIISTGGIGVGKAFYNLTINKTGNTATAGNNIDVDGNFTLSAGSWDLSNSNYNMNVAGNWTHSGTSIFTCRSGTVTFDGVNSTITTSSSGEKSFNNLIVDDAVTLGTSIDINGSLTINNEKSLSTSASNFAINVAGSWTNSGTFTSGTSTVTFDDAIASTIVTGGTGVGKAFYNLTINKSAAGNTVNMGADDLDVNQSFSLTRGTFNANDRTIYIYRHWTANAVNGVFNAGTSTVIFDGNIAQTINSGGVGAGKAFNHVTVNKSSNTASLSNYAIDILGNFTLSAGTWDVSATNYNMYVGGNWSNSATFTPRSGTVYFNGSGAQLITTGGTGSGKPFYNVVVDKSAETATLAGNIDINGSFTITNGTWDVSASNYSMNITGDWTNNGTFNAQSGTVTLDGTIASVNLNTGGVGASKAFYNLTINKGDGANAVNLGADNFDINGDFTITRGFFYTSNRDLFSAGNWTVNSVNGFFDAGNSTVTFDGSGAQVITPGGIGANKYFNNVTINKSAGTATLASAIDINSNFVLTSGTWDVSATNYNMNVAGNWTFNGGTFNPRYGTVVFDGSSQMTVDAGSTVFNNLNISNSAGIVLSSNLNIGNTLTMNQGDISTGVNTLIIGTSAVSVGTLNYVSGKVDGKIKRWYAASTNSGNSTGLFPIAVGSDYRPTLVEYTSAPSSGGSLTVQFVQTPMGWQNSGTSPLIPAIGACPEYRVTTYSEEGYWKIDNGDGLTGGTYDITLYANGLSTINDLCKLTAVKRVGAGLWVESGTHVAPSGTTANPIIKRTGASGWSNWGVAGGGTNELPVELVRFNAYCSDTEVNLSWVTSSEINNNYFTIERSTNGVDYFSIGQVQGSGNSNQTKEYFLIDNHKPDGVVYYRLKQTDFDGTENVFDPQVVSCRLSKTEKNISVMPNPFKETISINGTVNGLCVIEILGSIGENVYSTKTNIDGVLNLQLDFLKPGMYLIRIIETSGKIHLFKIVKN